MNQSTLTGRNPFTYQVNLVIQARNFYQLTATVVIPSHIRSIWSSYQYAKGAAKAIKGRNPFTYQVNLVYYNRSSQTTHLGCSRNPFTYQVNLVTHLHALNYTANPPGS